LSQRKLREEGWKGKKKERRIESRGSPFIPLRRETKEFAVGVLESLSNFGDGVGGRRRGNQSYPRSAKGDNERAG
jgi:hypothetical protein